MCYNFYGLIKIIVFFKFWVEEFWNSNNNFYRLWFRYKDIILFLKFGFFYLYFNILENNIIEVKEGRINRMRIIVVNKIVRLFFKICFFVYGLFWEFLLNI